MVAQITPLPTPPTRQDPANFSARGDAFLGALPQFQVEANAVASEISAKNIESSNFAASAQSSASIATIKATEAADSASSSLSYSQQSQEWANKIDGPVTPGNYSSRYYASQAAELTESYQGSLASDPVTDKNGQPLSAGDWYINSVTGFIRAYTGTTWVQGVSAVSGVTSVNGQIGDITGLVTLSGDETLTNKTFTGYTETVHQLSSNQITPSNGTIQYTTLSADISLTDGLLEGQSVVLMINPSTFTITWPTVVWVGNSASTAPSLTTGVYNCITFFKFAGALYGKYEGRT